MQPFRTVCTILVEKQPGIIPIEFGQMGIRRMISSKFSPQAGSILTPGALFEQLW